jgi:hypothetical protein
MQALWLLAVVVAFALGLGTAHLARDDRATTRELDHLRARESRLEQQVSTLAARLRAREVGPPASGSRQGGALASAHPGDRRDPAVSAPSTHDSSRALAGAAGGHAAEARPSAVSTARTGTGIAAGVAQTPQPAAGPPPTVEAALERFYRQFDGTSGRWTGMRQLADDLRAMGDVGAEALMRVLGGGTTSDERRMAAHLLGDMQVAQSLPLLQEILHTEGDVLLRRSSALALRRLQMPEAIPLMEALMSNPAEDRFVRTSAASGLAQLGRPQGVTALEQIFDESNLDGRGRDSAFRALRSLGDDRALPFMRRVIGSDADVTYRLQAIRFLSGQGDRQALPSLERLMQSPTEQPSIRDAAARAHAVIAAK